MNTDPNSSPDGRPDPSLSCRFLKVATHPETALQGIRKQATRRAQEESGYRQQVCVENGFFRYKSVRSRPGGEVRQGATERGRGGVSRPQSDGYPVD